MKVSANYNNNFSLRKQSHGKNVNTTSLSAANEKNYLSACSVSFGAAYKTKTDADNYMLHVRKRWGIDKKPDKYVLLRAFDTTRHTHSAIARACAEKENGLNLIDWCDEVFEEDMYDIENYPQTAQKLRKIGNNVKEVVYSRLVNPSLAEDVLLNYRHSLLCRFNNMPENLEEFSKEGLEAQKRYYFFERDYSNELPLSNEQKLREIEYATKFRPQLLAEACISQTDKAKNPLLFAKELTDYNDRQFLREQLEKLIVKPAIGDAASLELFELYRNSNLFNEKYSHNPIF